jgi:hypothetical protein
MKSTKALTNMILSEVLSMHSTERAIFQFQLQNRWWVAERIELEPIKNTKI